MRLGSLPINTALLLCLSCFASPQSAQPRLTFDVATIRPADPAEVNGGIKALPGGTGYTARNVPIKLMISLMYKIPMRQILEAPAWLDTDRYNVEARADHAYSLDDLHTMYQNLLADRLHLKFHIETREGNVYALTLATSDPAGLRMTPNTTAQDFNIPITFGAGGALLGKRVPMPYLTWFLGQQLQNDARPVVDLTGLTGNFDFTLTFAPSLPPGTDRDTLPPELRDRPTLFEAVRSQLGLKLTPQRGPVPYFIIDHVERPSEN